MATNQHVFKMIIDGDISNLEKTMNEAVKMVKKKYDEMDKASDKMKHLSGVVDYISQIDSALDALSKKDPTGFQKAFGSLDDGLVKTMEAIFGISNESSKVLGELSEKISSLKGNEGTVALKQIATALKDLFEVLGKAPPENLDLDGLFKGAANAENTAQRIEVLKESLSGLLTVWNDLSSKLGNGVTLGNTNVIEKKIADATSQIEKFKTLQDKLEYLASVEYKLEDGYGLPEDMSIEYTVKSVKELIVAYKTATAEKKKFEKADNINSIEYYENLINLATSALKLKDIILNESDELEGELSSARSISKNNETLYDDYINLNGQIFEFVGQIDSILPGASDKIQDLINSTEGQIDSLNQELKNVNSANAPTDNQMAEGIKQDTEETINIIDLAKKEIVNAWKEYYNAVEKAKNDGVKVEGGDSSQEMDDIKYSIDDMLDKWGVKKAVEGGYNPKIDLDLSEFIADGDIGFDDIEEEINKIFSENGITVDIPLEKISILGDKTQESSKEMSSGLQGVEVKTNDVTIAFQKLIAYISKMGSTPKSFFEDLVNGTRLLDEELSNILSSLKLMDAQGNLKLQAIESGFSNSGGMISDDYTLISRDKSKLQFSLAAKEKTIQAKAMGANIGAVQEVYETKDAIYELQNTVKGKGILDFEKGIVNTEFLEATSDKIEKLIKDLEILQNTGLYVDWNGNNILYDEKKGFSFIDFFTAPYQPGHITADENNSVQDNLDIFFDKIFNEFNLGTSDSLNAMAFKNKVMGMIPNVITQNGKYQDSNKDVKASVDATTSSLSKEEAAREQNTNSINEENKALQAQIELKKKAQSMTWENFAKDGLNVDLISSSGIESIADLEQFWKKSNYEKDIKFRELSEQETQDILNSGLDYNLRADWYLDENFDAKSKIENAILANNELRNAAMNKLYQLYQKKYNDATVSFNDFLEKELSVYRGDKTPIAYDQSQLMSFSFDKEVAGAFVNHDENYVKEVKIIPKETIGSASDPSFFDDEFELFVPASKLASTYYSDKSFDEAYNKLTDETKQKKVDAALIQQASKKVQGILGDEITSLLEQASHSDQFNNDVISKFKQGIVPESLDIIGDIDADVFAVAYNSLSEMQKKMVAYYASLQAQLEGMPEIFDSDRKEIGSTGIIGSVLNDKMGVQQHIAQLTSESKFSIFGQTAQDIQSETVTHQQNTKAIQDETYAQQQLNNSKQDYKDVQDELVQSSFDEVDYKLWNATLNADGDKMKELTTIWDSIAGVHSTEKDDRYNLIGDGQYQSFVSDEVFDYTDLVDMIDAFEAKYGESLDYVKNYLNQVFKDYNAYIDNISNAIEYRESDDELQLDGFNLDRYDLKEEDYENYSWGISGQELKNEQAITAEKQKQAALDSDITDTPIQDQNIELETAALNELQTALVNVKEAIQNKTLAFQEEGAVVGQVIDQEVAALKTLLDILEQIANYVNTININLDTINNTKLTDNGANNKNESSSEIVTSNDTDRPVQEGYALNTTVLETNRILGEISGKIGNNESFSELVDPLNNAAIELKNVASGIVEHQKSQKTDLTDASTRISNNYGELSSITGTAVVGLGNEVQIENMKALADNIVRVRGAVQDAQGVWKGFVVDINESNNAVVRAVDEQSKFAQSLNESAQAAKKVQETPVQDDLTTKIHEQTNALNEYRNGLKNVGYISDELNEKFDTLGTSLKSVVDADGLEAWKSDFKTIKDEISIAATMFEKKQLNASAKLIGSANAQVKTLNFKSTDANLAPDQQKIIDLQEQLNNELTEYELKIKKGLDANLDAANKTKTALDQEIAAYKERNNIVNASGNTNKKAYGATSVKNATTKYNSLNNIISTEELQQSAIIQEKLKQYTAAYRELINVQSKFKIGESPTKEQEQEFDEARTACTKYAKELEKLLNVYNKSKTSSTSHNLLEGDFKDTSDGREKALKQLMEDTYGANASIVKFDDNYNKLIYTVDNGNGTFTTMTSVINNTRTAIDTTAGEVKEATSVFASFWNELKGKFKSIGAYLMASFSIQEVFQQLRKGVEYVREIDSALTELKKVTNETDAAYSQFLQNMSKTAGVVGSTVADLTTMAAEWARLNI